MRIVVRLAAVLFAMVLPALALAAPQAKNSRLDQVIDVLPLNDPANPFRDQYTALDEWVFAHALPPDQTTSEDRWENRYMVIAYVDERGIMLPALEAARLGAEAAFKGQRNPTHAVYSYQFDASGSMDRTAVWEARTQLATVKAPYYPQIPDWLAQSPPEWSIVLPDGRVILKAHDRSNHWEPPGFLEWSVPNYDMHGWWLYGRSGQLVRATQPLSWWWEATIPDFRERIAGYIEPYVNAVQRYGMIHVYNMQTRKSIVNFSWDGTPLPANTKVTNPGGNNFSGIHGFDMPIIYAAQQKLKGATSN